ncbi:MAG: hypothetical protein H3C62_06805 [Gemmatimonadaceae bacterium]|nr:hypothetical protein [Gemmatimonadaceae bacterium]
MTNRSPIAIRSAAALALLFSLVVAPADAQGARGEGVGPGSAFPFSSVFFGVGGSVATTRELNARLDTANYFAVSNDAISYGGGARVGFGRMIFGGEFAITDFGEEGDPQSGRTSALRSRFYVGQFGYAVWAGRHLNVYPMLGVGAGTMVLTLSDRTGGGAPPSGVDPSFTEIALHPNYSSKLEATYLLFEPAVGADWLVLRSVGDRFGVTIGARVGAKFAPNRAAWRLDGRKVIGGPDVGPDGMWFRLTAGIGWR